MKIEAEKPARRMDCVGHIKDLVPAFPEVFGIGFRQAGKLNRGFVVPTGAFLRWYLRIEA